MNHAIVDQAGGVERTERAWLHGPTAQFVRHLAEMVLAMMLGMAVLGFLVRGVMGALGYPDGLRPYPELFAVAMTLEMTVAMAGWMLFRGHRRAIVAEMSGAMVAPVLVVVALCLIHVLPSTSAPTLAHVIMYPAMLGAMIHRRTEYTRSHRSAGHAAVTKERSAQDMHARPGSG
jgi:flagellar biosynthetic protein FliP